MVVAQGREGATFEVASSAVGCLEGRSDLTPSKESHLVKRSRKPTSPSFQANETSNRGKKILTSILRLSNRCDYLSLRLREVLDTSSVSLNLSIEEHQYRTHRVHR